MNASEVETIVTAIVEKKRHDGRRPHELVVSLHRRRFPGDFFPLLEPLLHIDDGKAYKYAIDILGKLKDPTPEVSDAIEAAWERSWQDDVPQACPEAFTALLRIGKDGENDARLLRMIERSMQVDNYGIHRECATALMKIAGGEALLTTWDQTIAGRCDCHLHKKLAAKISAFLQESGGY